MVQNKINLRRTQGGMSFWMLLVMVILLVIVGGAALKAAPSYLEYMAAQKAIDTAAREGSVKDALRAFERTAQIDDITSIDGKDLIVEKSDSGTLKVSFEYEKRIPLAGPVSLVIDYAGEAGE